MNARTSILRSIASNWPFENGSGRFLDSVASQCDLGRGEVDCLTSDGFKMRVFADDLIGRHILMSGKFDRSTVAALADFAERGDVILDVGANIGYVSCLLLTLIPDSVAYCVEPQPDVAALLRRNVGQFGEARAHVLEAALSDEDAELPMRIDDQNRGRSSLDRPSEGRTIMIPAVSTDRYLAGFERVDLVKIDVEGHEVRLFENASAQLARLQPRAVLFESEGAEAAPAGRIAAVLDGAGYDVFGLKKSLLATTLRPIRSAEDCDCNDYIAVSRSRALPAKARARLGR
ncbi:FkbM family methyltransferase [Hansschlegelia plantiphila]|uniref:Methyltransferase FkbM domain-containing protein n=1 Tax=Hansschlegelia plantiphila TaxID=374655 RepID=A0A9W6J4M9_9HYPH|nr:FkbM family methyltransferase [Hansschlegelia plantiphila]GLK69726.1 hypothetical protein GCM10008179_33640 [Hansschlegelia plantiphila]